MKVTNQNERKPSPFVMPHTVHKKKWGSQFTTELSRNSGHHSGRVCHSIEPKRPRHLLFHKVGPIYVDHDFPMGFHKTLERLATRHGRNTIGAVIN
jgi:hypothetical protein